MDIRNIEYCGKLMFFGVCVLKYVYADCADVKTEWNDKIPKNLRFAFSFRWYITATLHNEMRTTSGNLEEKPAF